MRPELRIGLGSPWAIAALGLLLALGLCFRWLLLSDYQAAAGDGWNYYQLSQELLLGRRYAYGPEPLPLAYSRLPGYPLFLAYVAVRRAPVAMGQHLLAATRWNVLLDLGTALLVFLILRNRGQRNWAGVLGAFLVLCCPLLFTLSSYGLTEPLATFLGTLVFYLLLRGMHSRPLLHAAIAGVLTGYSVLVRLDMLSMFPVAVITFLLTNTSWRQRLQAFALFTLLAAAVYSPWPIRNQLRFGVPHFEGAEMMSQLDGTPLPTGVMRWMSTWSTGRPGESYILLMLSKGFKLNVEQNGVLLPAMYDSEAERKRVVALFRRYNEQRLSPAVNRAFRRLAFERMRRAPLRTFLLLPLQRTRSLFTPIPEYELPMESKRLDLPDLRQMFTLWSMALYILAFCGALHLCRGGRDDRRTALLFAAIPLARTALVCSANWVPTQRLLAEAFPALILLATVALTEFIPSSAHLALKLQRDPG